MIYLPESCLFKYKHNDWIAPVWDSRINLCGHSFDDSTLIKRTRVHPSLPSFPFLIHLCPTTNKSFCHYFQLSFEIVSPLKLYIFNEATYLTSLKGLEGKKDLFGWDVHYCQPHEVAWPFESWNRSMVITLCLWHPWSINWVEDCDISAFVNFCRFMAPQFPQLGI